MAAQVPLSKVAIEAGADYICILVFHAGANKVPGGSIEDAALLARIKFQQAHPRFDNGDKF